MWSLKTRKFSVVTRPPRETKNMRIAPIVVMAFAAALAATTSAGAASITTLYNTGVDSSGTPLSDGTVGDPHYNLVSVPGGSTTDILVRTSAGGYPIPPYIGDDTLSAWIGPNNDNNLDGPNGTYIYQTTFNLTGFNAATAAIVGGWTSDNDGIGILLNGNNTGTPPTDFAQFSLGFAPFTISGGFLPGLNTLDFLVDNGGGPTALRVEMSGTADLAATPLPSTWTMLIAGFIALGFFAYRGNKKGSAAIAAA